MVADERIDIEVDSLAVLDVPEIWVLLPAEVELDIGGETIDRSQLPLGIWADELT